YFGMGPKKGSDGQLVITFPLADKKIPGIAAEDIGKCAYGIFKKGDEFIGKTMGISVRAELTSFAIRRGCQEFAVETTSLSTDAISDRSTWKHDFTHLSGGAFQLVTPILRTRVGQKMEQLSSIPLPRVLAITSEHQGADALLGDI